MVLNGILAVLALLSVLLLLWQWFVARRFPLHQRATAHSFPPTVSLLKPLKGCEPTTEECLRSCFTQDYTGRVQLLFGVAAAEDPVCNLVRKLQNEFPQSDSQLIVCDQSGGANAKVATLTELERVAKHDLFIISDADVRVPADLLSNLVEPLRDRDCGLVNCFYRFANPVTMAMRWEAICVNADFWSQVLQSKSIKPLDFALGAVMAIRRKELEEIGGFRSLADCLADDYQLGNRIAQKGYRIDLCSVVVECWSSPIRWRDVWQHQLRWARTIRVCQPVPYFFSILSNATLWPFLWLLIRPSVFSLVCALAACGLRIVIADDLNSRIAARPITKPESPITLGHWSLVLFKDLLQPVIWFLAFVGNRVEWRGQTMVLRRDGTLAKA